MASARPSRIRCPAATLELKRDFHGGFMNQSSQCKRHGHPSCLPNLIAHTEL